MWVAGGNGGDGEAVDPAMRRSTRGGGGCCRGRVTECATCALRSNGGRPRWLGKRRGVGVGYGPRKPTDHQANLSKATHTPFIDPSQFRHESSLRTTEVSNLTCVHDMMEL